MPLQHVHDQRVDHPECGHNHADQSQDIEQARGLIAQHLDAPLKLLPRLELDMPALTIAIGQALSHFVEVGLGGELDVEDADVAQTEITAHVFPRACYHVPLGEEIDDDGCYSVVPFPASRLQA